MAAGKIIAVGIITLCILLEVVTIEKIHTHDILVLIVFFTMILIALY